MIVKKFLVGLLATFILSYVPMLQAIGKADPKNIRKVMFVWGVLCFIGGILMCVFSEEI